MIKPKHLDMQAIEKLFNEHFTFNKNDLNKGYTVFTLTPKRDNSENKFKNEKGL
jgi:hypothetical protein